MWLIVRSACASERTCFDNIIIAIGDVLETSGHLICQPCGELRLFGYFIVLAAELIDPNRPAILLSRSRFERAGGIWTASLSL